MLPLFLLFIASTNGRPQIFAHPAAGEPVTQAATTQVVAPVVTLRTGRAPAVAQTTAAQTTFDDGLYHPNTQTTVRNAKTVALSTADDTDDDLPSTTASVALLLPTTSSSSQMVNAIIATMPLSTVQSTSSLVMPSLTSSSSAAPSASFSSANDATDSSSSDPSTSSVVIPLVIIGVVILLALIGGILWSRKNKIKRWWSGQPDEQGQWDEKRDYYRDGGFDPYTGRSGGNWPLGGEDFGAGDDRYGPVSSRIRQSVTPQPHDPYEEVGTERGWLWGTRRVSERDLLASHDPHDAMLAQSRTGYLPSEAAARLNRQPSYFARAGAAIVSSLSTNRRSRRVAKLSGENRAGIWDEHGSWRPLQNQEETPKRLPAVPGRLDMSAFSGINQGSVARPSMAAAADESPMSRSVKRWQLADGPPRSLSPSPSPSKGGRILPPSLQTRQAGYSSPVSPRGQPDLFYSTHASSPTRAMQQPLSASHSGVPSLVFSGSRGATPPPALPAKSDVFDAYAARRSPSPTKAQRGLEVEKRPVSRMSQRSGSLTELVSRLLDEDEF